MKLIKSSVLIVSVLFLLVGSIGVDVFSHFCEQDEVSVSYFVADEDHCDDHKVESHLEASCHDSEEQHCESHKDESDACCSSENDDDCCEDELNHVQLKLDYFNKVAVSAVIIPEFTTELFFVYEENPTDLAVTEYNNNSPPPDSGRELILKKQHWLI